MVWTASLRIQRRDKPLVIGDDSASKVVANKPLITHCLDFPPQHECRNNRRFFEENERKSCKVSFKCISFLTKLKFGTHATNEKIQPNGPKMKHKAKLLCLVLFLLSLHPRNRHKDNGAFAEREVNLDETLDQSMQLYQIEREDSHAMSSVNATMVSVAIAYTATMFAFLADHENRAQAGKLIIAAPFPAIALECYIVIQAAAMIVRRMYLEKLEIEMSCRAIKPRYYLLYNAGLFNPWNFPNYILLSVFTMAPLLTSTGFTYYVYSASDPPENKFESAIWVTYAIILASSLYVMIVTYVQCAKFAEYLWRRTDDKIVKVKRRRH